MRSLPLKPRRIGSYMITSAPRPGKAVPPRAGELGFEIVNNLVLADPAGFAPDLGTASKTVAVIAVFRASVWHGTLPAQTDA